MVFTWLKKTLNLGRPQTTPASVTAAHKLPSAPAVKTTTMYPPNDRGLAVREVQDILDGNKFLIDRLKLHAACDLDVFEARYLAPVRALAEHINIVPATATGLFSGEGGLFSACLELGFLSFQASDGRIFTGMETVERRHKLEPRWRYVCFLAGLLYPIGEPIGRMTVTSSTGANWRRHHQTLTQWASDIGVDRVYLFWADQPATSKAEDIGPGPYSASILYKIAGPDNLAWLEEGDTSLSRVLLELVGGHESSAKIAKDVIAVMWEKVKEREEARRPQNYGRLTVGTHLPPYLVGAMRTLLESGVWRVNEQPLLVDSTGVYVVWPKAGEDIVKQGATEGRQGWPSAASTLAEIMMMAGIFDTTRGNDMGMVEVVDGSGEIHVAFKLKTPNAVYADYSSQDYAKKSPKTLDALIEADSLAQPKVKETVAKQPETEFKDRLAAPAIDPPVPHEESDSEADQSDEDQPAAATDVPQAKPSDAKASDAVTPAATAGKAPKARKEKKAAPVDVPPGKIAEVPEVKYADLVPEDIRKQLKSPLTVELLGKVLKAWRERGEDSTVMRMTDKGAAINYEFLSSLMRNPLDWVTDMGQAGLIYTPLTTPGLKVQKVAIPEGSKPREAIVISQMGCRKMEL